MKRMLSLLLVFAFVFTLTGCKSLHQKEIDAIYDYAESTNTELVSVEYNSKSKIIVIVGQIEGINSILTGYLDGDADATENWNAMKEMLPISETALTSHLNELGYAIAISLSLVDPNSTNVPLLTSQNGEIVYKATAAPKQTNSIIQSEDQVDPARNDSADQAGTMENNYGDPEVAISALKEVFPQMENEFNTFSIQYNESTGTIEILNIMRYIAQTLEIENISPDSGESSPGQVTIREGVVENWDLFDTIIKDNGCSFPITLSIADTEEPDKLLLTVSDGEIVYDAYSLEAGDSSNRTESAPSTSGSESTASLSGDPNGAVAFLEEYLTSSQGEVGSYVVRYNETTGIIEIYYLIPGLSDMLQNTLTGVGDNLVDWDSMREFAVGGCGDFGTIVRDRGYTGSISLSFSDSNDPYQALLTALDGVIVYDVVE